MDDLIKCPKCGKDTNKYYPYCERCSEPLSHEAPNRSGSPSAAGLPAGAAGAIDGRGADIFAEPGKRPNRTMKCPFCAEEVLADAIKCRFCGEFIKKPAADENRYRVLLLSFLAGVALMLIIVLVYLGTRGAPEVSRGIRYSNDPSADLKRDPAKSDYVKKYITVSDIGMLEETDTRGAVTKYLSGAIRNAGDKTVIKLVLGVYYFDKNGRCIGEGTVAPVLGTKAKPASIKPAASHDFKLPILNVHPDWSGKIKEKVTDIELL